MIFPPILPNCSQLYTAASNPMLAVTQFETNFRQRKKYSNDQERVQVGWLFNQFEFDVFKKFVRDLIKGGSDSFFLNIIGTNGLESREVQIVGGKYSSQYVSHAHHKVTCELLVVTNSVMTNNQYNLALLTGSNNEVALAQTISPASNIAATLTLSTNNILITADTAGSSGNDISMTILTPAAQATTTVAVDANDITVTPGTKARMIVTGDLTSDGTTPVVIPPLLYAGLYAGSPAWSDTGLLTTGSVFVYNQSWAWGLSVMTNVGERLWQSVVGSGVGSAFPMTGWTHTFQAGDHDGIPVFATEVSSAAQVIAAVNASTPAAALVTASASGTVTEAVSAVSTTNLSGGGVGIPGSFTNQFCKVGTVAPFTWYKWNGSVWLEHPDIPIYANLTAANAALPNNTLFYDSTLSKLYVTTA